MLWSLLLWAGLSVLFLWRLRVILGNFQFLVTTPRSSLPFIPPVPRIDLRPIKQLAIWLTELGVLLFLYQGLGTSALSHMVATVIAAWTMVLLRERSEANPLRSIQVLPMRPAAQRRGAIP